MERLIVTPRHPEDIDKLVSLLNASDVDVTIEKQDDVKPPFRKLTTADLAFGIGRPATSEELKDYLERHKDRTFIDIDEAFDIILERNK